MPLEPYLIGVLNCFEKKRNKKDATSLTGVTVEFQDDMSFPLHPNKDHSQFLFLIVLSIGESKRNGKEMLVLNIIAVEVTLIHINLISRYQ